MRDGPPRENKAAILSLLDLKAGCQAVVCVYLEMMLDSRQQSLGGLQGKGYVYWYSTRSVRNGRDISEVSFQILRGNDETD